MRAWAAGRVVDWPCVVVGLDFPGMTSGQVVCLRGRVLKQPKESVRGSWMKPRGCSPGQTLATAMNVRKNCRAVPVSLLLPLCVPAVLSRPGMRELSK